jgi:hypothetical protein
MFEKERIRMAPAEDVGQTLRIKLVDPCQNYQMVTLRIVWASFAFNITVYIEDAESPFHSLQSISTSPLSTIFLSPDNQSAIKCSCYQ